jgi:sortase (surface protein transpeptidase)
MQTNRPTLDSMGIRPRPRTYVDAHTPKPRGLRGGLVHDVAPPTMPHSEPAIPRAAVPTHPVGDVELRVAASVAQNLFTAQKPSKVSPRQQMSYRPHSLKPDVPAPTRAPQVYAPIHTPSNNTQTSPLEQPALLSGLVDQLRTADNTIDAELRGEVVPATLSRLLGAAKKSWSTLMASPRAAAISMASLLLFLGGTYALVGAIRANSAVTAQVRVITEVASAQDTAPVEPDAPLDSNAGMPSEEPVSESRVVNYTPPPDEPRYISIPKLKTKRTRVLKMGTDGQGAIQTPRNTWDTGWFDGSSSPSDSVGSALIVGHVSGYTSGGIFYNLYRLEDGDTIDIEMGNGVRYTYRVVGKEEVPLEGINMNKYLVSKDIDKPGLTIMTCAGEYNAETQTYENRLAIFAVRDK